MSKRDNIKILEFVSLAYLCDNVVETASFAPPWILYPLKILPGTAPHQPDFFSKSQWLVNTGIQYFELLKQFIVLLQIMTCDNKYVHHLYIKFIIHVYEHNYFKHRFFQLDTIGFFKLVHTLYAATDCLGYVGLLFILATPTSWPNHFKIGGASPGF